MLCIVGCGNLNRRDDGVGVFIVRRLVQQVADQHVPDLKIVDAGTGGMDVMFQARGANSMIIIDASRSGSTPGSVFEVPADNLVNVPEPSYTLHNFRWDHAIFDRALPIRLTQPNRKLRHRYSRESCGTASPLKNTPSSAGANCKPLQNIPNSP